MNLTGEPLPLLWTGDFIPADGPNGSTVYIVGRGLHSSPFPVNLSRFCH